MNINQREMKRIYSSLAKLVIILPFLILPVKMKQKEIPGKTFTCLSLGDSYTIGEQVRADENFPNQVRKILNDKGIIFEKPDIIAKTGWTTDELQQAIIKENPGRHYDIVTLLIGVNNQYRDRKVTGYIPEFESLLKQAIQFADNYTSHVIVISIPDWGVTPFAAERDREQITRKVNEYNAANKSIAEKYGVHYIDITPGTREAAVDLSLLTTDGLHPSGKEYRRWAVNIASVIQNNF
jgi:lysophospholipase L1-like esterase